VDLTRRSARETNQQQVTVLVFNGALFSLAAGVGLVLFGVLTHRLAAPFAACWTGPAP
jgi:hypothetical protein